MLQAMHMQRQGTSDKPTLHEMWHVIYVRSFIHYALCVCILINVYMPNHLVYHVPTTNASIFWHIVHLVHNVYLFHILFHSMGLRSTTTSLLVSQLCKYICMYITCQVIHAHFVHILSQHQMLKANSNMWARF